MITVCDMCEAVKEREILEAIKRAQKEEKRKEEERKMKEKIIMNTIHWCDTVLSDFMAEKMATSPTMNRFNTIDKIMFVIDKGWYWSNLFYGELENENIIVHQVTFSEPFENGFTSNHNQRYKREYKVSNEEYDLDTIKTYCKNFGWNISLYYYCKDTTWTEHHVSHRLWYNYLVIEPIKCEKNK